MKEDANNPTSDGLQRWADDLACPVCFSALHFSASTVNCTGCGRVYPVVDDIPVLIPQRATGPSGK